MDYQIRIRTDEKFHDMEYIKQWLYACAYGFAFEHNKPGNHHYHIYLFGLDRKDDPMRKHLGRHLPAKECYSVSTTAGRRKEKLKAHIAYQYGMEEDYKTPVWKRNIDDDELAWREEGMTYYESQKKGQKPVTEIMVITEQKERPDRVWMRLWEDVLENPDVWSCLTLTAIKSKIAVGYLRQCKPVPRPSDLHRYSVSILYMCKHQLYKEGTTIDDNALLGEYAR